MKRTQVGIVGAGPAGLMLARLLHRAGIESIVLENRSRQHVEERIRAGVLEQGTVDLLRQAGVAERLDREGLRHDGVELAFARTRHRIDFAALTGKSITVYGQHEVIKDLIQANLAAGIEIRFETSSLAIHDFENGGRPKISYSHEGARGEIACDFIAGCDGFHGICRASIPASVLQVHEREYAYAWLGILAEAPPASKELVYAHHDRGFALFSMRSPQVTRLYLQCAPEEDLALWPDTRIWDELLLRLSTADGWAPAVGPILQKGVTGMRSFVAEPMRFGRLFLAGDAAHIVPPTGAKGMNLAIADVAILARGLEEFYREGTEDLLNRYSDTCLRRVWKAQRFSWWLTSLLHRSETGDSFERHRQLAELEYLVHSRAAMTSMAENYVGFTIETDLPLSHAAP